MRLVFNFFWAILATSLATATVFFYRLAGKGYLVAPYWSRLMVWGMGIRVLRSGLERFNNSGPYIIMMNHRSYADVLSLFVAFPGIISFVAKKELLYIPIFGQGMWLAQTVIIDRGDKRNSKRVLMKAVDVIRGGRSVMIFPEGTRSRDGSTLGPFKKGGFHLALATRVPILPAAVVESEKIMPRGSMVFRPGPVKIVFGAPLPVTGEESLEQLMERTRSAIVELTTDAESAAPERFTEVH